MSKMMRATSTLLAAVSRSGGCVTCARQFARGTGYGVGAAQQAARQHVGSKQGMTLKQRIMAPTTGAPYKVGQIAVAGGAALGVGALCFYGLGLSNKLGALEKSTMWPQYVRDRVHATYGYLGGSLALTAGAAAAVFRSPTLMRLATTNSLVALFGTLAAVMGTHALCYAVPYNGGVGLKQLAWMLHTGTIGFVIAPLCLLGGPLILRAAVYTAGIVGGLSAVAFCAPSDKFLNMAGPLSMGLGVVFVSSIGTWFLPPTTALGAGLMSIAVYGGLLLFSGFLLYDTQRVIKLAEHYPPGNHVAPFDPINAQIGLYINTINIFIRMVMILGMGGNRRK